MRLLVQSVSQARVVIQDLAIDRSIHRGILVYVWVHCDDAEDYKNKVDRFVSKLLSLRRLKSDDDRLDASLDKDSTEIMVISNFTLYAQNKKGSKMSFSASASAEVAEPIYNYFVQSLRDAWFSVQTGEFAAMMEVHATTIGPINYVLDL